MGRPKRLVIPNVPHHVTHRGNRSEGIFRDSFDRKVYLKYLREETKRHGVKVWGYCLMTNHVHLIIVPPTLVSLAEMVRQTHHRYAIYFNRRYDYAGHLWQERYFSCPMDIVHLARALLYVDLNPVRAGLTNDALSYQWSSARAHCGDESSPILDPDFKMSFLSRDWRKELSSQIAPDFIAGIRMATKQGRPYGKPKLDAPIKV